MKTQPIPQILTILVALALPILASAANISMTANDVNGVVTSFNGAGKWSDGNPPSPANDYYSSTFYIRSPASVSATTYTFGGNSLTLQAYATASARSLIFKGVAGDVLNINNFTNAAGALINEGSGTAGFTIGGNLWTIAGNSAIWSDQNGPIIINSPLAGTANFTNLAYASTITYNGTNSAFTGKLVMGSGTIVFNSASNVLGNPAILTPDQYTLGASATLTDNAGVTLNAVNSGVTLTGAATINTATAGFNTVVQVPIVGAFGLTKSGAGALTLSGVNTFSGLTATAGQLNINSSTALGAPAGAFNINGVSTIDNTSGGVISNANNNPVTISSSFTFAGSSDLNLGTGSVNNGSLAKTITVSAGNLTFRGGFIGAGQIVMAGNGTLVLGGASPGMGGGLVVSQGTLALTGGALITNAPNISIASGATLDVSGLASTFTLGASRSQSISNSTGVVNGSVTTAGVNASISPDAGFVAGTLTFNNNLNLNAGGSTFFDLSTTYNSGNDQIIVGGNLTLSSADTININALSGSSPLDQTADYVLFSVSGTTTMTTTPALVWNGTPPSNAGNFTIKQSGNNVVLRYSAGTPPTVYASINPDPSVHNQAVTITANVTKGSASIASVTVNLTAIGGSSTAGLVLNGASSSDPNFVYTNTFTVAASAPVGSLVLPVTATDTTSPSPLLGLYNLSMTVNASSVTWDGGGADNNWNSATNWVDDVGPGLVGDSVTFSGLIRLNPNLETKYSVAGVTFDGTAGAFTIGSTGGYTLGLSSGSGIVNYSANPQTLNVPIAMSAAQTLDAESGPMIFSQNITNGGNLVTLTGPTNTTISGAISGGGGLTMAGNGVLTLTGNNTFTGNVFANNAGTIVIDSGGAVNNGGNYSSIGQNGGDNATLTLKGTGTFTNSADFNLGDLDSSVGTLNMQNSASLSVGQLYIGSANAAGSTASGIINQTGGSIIETNAGVGFFVIGGRTSASGVGVYNMSGGTLTAAAGIRVGSAGTGIMTLSGSAAVNALGGINIARLAGSTGTLNLDGGTVTTLNITSSTGINATNNFNGATVRPTTANTWVSGLTQCNVRNGGAVLDTTNLNVTISQALQHSVIAGDNAIDGGLIKSGTGTLTLTGVNTYTGPTLVNAGALAGTGTIAGVLTNNATLAPGVGGSGSLTVNGNITLKTGSTNTFTVNGTTPANTSVIAGGNVIYGGVLTIVTNGTFTAGQQFQLFSGVGATNASNFASISGNPGSGLAFTFTNGVLSVATGSVGPVGPEHLTNSYSAGVLSLSWPAGEGWRLQMQTNSLSTGLSTNWNYLTDGSVSSTNITVDPTKPTVFYRLTYP